MNCEALKITVIEDKVARLAYSNSKQFSLEFFQYSKCTFSLSNRYNIPLAYRIRKIGK